jgi:hypothetical protein
VDTGFLTRRSITRAAPIGAPRPFRDEPWGRGDYL